jgi:hypothetical protein
MTTPNKGLVVRISLSVIFLVAAALVVFAKHKQTAAGNNLPWGNNPPDYRIIYLTTEGNAEARKFTAPDVLESTLGAQTVYTGNDSMFFNDASPLDAIIIHDSAMSLVDNKWLANIYRKGVIVVTFNIDGFELASVLQDECVGRNEFARSNSYRDVDFFAMVFFYISGPVEGIKQILSASHCDGPVLGIEGHVQVAFGKTEGAIANQSDYNTFAQVLVTNIKQLKSLAGPELETDSK